MGYLGQIEPPIDLEQRILRRINLLVVRRARTRLAVFGFLATGSLASLLYVLVIIGRSLLQSSFYQYLQLLWSDQTIWLTYWRELSWSLLESLPVLGLTIILAIGGLFLWSILKVLENNNYYGFKKFA
jgi:hypothetical protein